MNSTESKRGKPGRAVIALAGLCCACAFALPDDAAAQARNAPTSTSQVEEVGMVLPALEHYTDTLLLDEVWKRPDLSPRDRSIVTVTALIARNQPAELPYYLHLALDSGVKAGEIAEIITHLAFYSGWPNAMAAVSQARIVFAERKIGAGQLPPAKPVLLPLDRAAVR